MQTGFKSLRIDLKRLARLMSAGVSEIACGTSASATSALGVGAGACANGRTAGIIVIRATAITRTATPSAVVIASLQPGVDVYQST
jgi:hypothetical protein